MSDYGKPAQTQAHEQSHLPLVSAPSQPSGSDFPHYPQRYSSQTKILSGPTLSRNIDDSTRSYGQSEHLPTVVSYSPREGKEGDLVVVVVHIPGVTASSALPNFRITFGYYDCPVSFQHSPGQPGDVHLTAKVPSFSDTQFSSHQLELQLLVDGTKVPIGKFSYQEPARRQSAPHLTSPSTALPQLKKRKADDEFEPEKTTPVKRPILQNIRPKKESFYFSEMGPPATSYHTYTQPSDRGYVYGNSYDQTTNSIPILDRSPHSGYPYTLPEVTQSSQVSPLTNSHVNWNPNFHRSPSALSGPIPALKPEPISIPAASSHTQLLARSPSDANPPLIRTSTLQTGVHSGARGGGFNPYGIYPHKAILAVQGNLDSMASNWSADEWDNRRRLVQFWRQQKGNTIHATFQPVLSSERHPPSICISCIWWQEKGECYVTSVDCIALLESLIAVRFTVEEKNRIRRNLEGFKPLTVSKGKPESENFFKLIMAFPDPKPRNIEKDVKVFPWKILHEALKKIIGKYSASYSSTAGLIPSTGSMSYPPTGHSQLNDPNAIRRASLQSSHPLSPDHDHRPSIPGLSASSSTLASPNIPQPNIKQLGEEDLLPSYNSLQQIPPPIDPIGSNWSHPPQMHARTASSVSRSSWDLGSYSDGTNHMGHGSQGNNLPDLHQDHSLHRQA